MDIIKGKLCPKCKRLCGNATKKCPLPCGFDFTILRSDDPMETEEDSANETASENGSDSGEDEIEEPCEDSSAEETWFSDDSSEASEEEEESVDPAWEKKNNFSKDWPKFQYKDGFTQKWSWNSPFECFSAIWDSAIMEQLVTQTNLYGKAKSKSKWEDVTYYIMKWWVSIVLVLSLAPYRGHLRDIWSNNPITRNEFIALRFPRKLFEKIKGALYWVENRRFSKEEKQNNKSYKIKTLLSKICANSSKIRTLPEIVSIDESMIPYKGKTSRIRQYITNKPTRWGFKLWMLSDMTGYCYNSLIYEGVKYVNGKKVTTQRLGKDVVFDLMSNYLGRKHIVITDNFYTSVKLAEGLLEKDTYLVGQIKVNAKGTNSEWKKEKKKELKSNKGNCKLFY
jgi:hypothetical protein